MICFSITVIYALLQFVFGIKETQIPGITMNYDDYMKHPDNWWAYKNNDVHVVSKIFSTYQNGNVYGMIILMCYPLLIYSLKKKGIFIQLINFIIFLLVSFLTGSRTVWIGALIYIMILIFSPIVAGKVKAKSFIVFFTIVFVLPVLLQFYLSVTGGGTLPIDRLIYSLKWDNFIKGAGRTEGIVMSFQNALQYGSMFHYIFGFFGSNLPVGASEMVYFMILFAYGIVGLFLFLQSFAVIMLYIRQYRNKDVIIKGFYTGLLIYFMCAFIEGCYGLPPTNINLCTFLAIAYKKAELYRKFNEKIEKREIIIKC